MENLSTKELGNILVMISKTVKTCRTAQKKEMIKLEGKIYSMYMESKYSDLNPKAVLDLHTIQ